MEATREAREGTLDFGRAGKEGRRVNRYSPFFNAAVQDPVLFVEKFKENPARMVKRVAPMVFGSMVLYNLIRSNPQSSKEYDEMMPYERNMFWNVPVPKSVCQTGWLRFPKPFGPGFLFASLPERMMDYASGREKSTKAAKEWLKGFADTMVPGSLPPLLSASIEWTTGYNFFQGRQVENMADSRKKPWERYDEKSSEVAKMLANTPLAKWLSTKGPNDVGKIEISPKKLDNLGQNLFAGAYGMFTNADDARRGVRKLDNPLTTFTLDPYKSSQSLEDYYDQKKEVEDAIKDRGGVAAIKKANKNDPLLKQHKLITKGDEVLKKLNDELKGMRKYGNDKAILAKEKQRTMKAQELMYNLNKYR